MSCHHLSEGMQVCGLVGEDTAASVEEACLADTLHTASVDVETGSPVNVIGACYFLVEVAFEA